jgi:hypothetical protein
MAADADLVAEVGDGDPGPVPVPLPGPLAPVSTQKLPPRQATTPWLLPAQPITLASPKGPYTVWLPAGPLDAQPYGAAVAGAALAVSVVPAGAAPKPAVPAKIVG